MATDGRISQEVVEVVVGGQTSQARISQLAIEVVAVPPGAEGRISQLAIEVVAAQADLPAASGYKLLPTIG